MTDVFFAGMLIVLVALFMAVAIFIAVSSSTTSVATHNLQFIRLCMLVQKDGFRSTFFLQSMLISTVLAVFLIVYAQMAATANDKRKDHR